MSVEILPHAMERATERGATVDEINLTVKSGETFPAKHGRVAFRRNFNFDGEWNGKFYQFKQIEAFAEKENNNWIVITVIVKYFEFL